MTVVAEAEALRTCRDCGVQAWTEADLEGFQKNSSGKFGRKNRCRPCQSARVGRWRNANPEYMREWRKANRDRILEYKRGYNREYCSGALRDRFVWDVREMPYRGIHNRLRAHFGRASDYKCVHCNGPAREWAYTQDDEDCRYGDGGRGYAVAYSLKPEFYMPLCVDCHRAFDAEHRKGH